MRDKASASGIETNVTKDITQGAGDVREMAQALFRAGVAADDVRYEWGEGRRMMTPGQQVALRAEIRRLDRQVHGLSIAA